MSKIKKDGGKQSKLTQSNDIVKKERKTKYHSHIQPYLMAIKAMMRSGATMEILSQKFDVAVSTLYEYREKHTEFSDAIKENAEIADFTIEAHLFEMAKTDKVAAFFWLKNRQAKRWRDKQHVFQASSTTIKKDYDLMTDAELEHEMDMLEGVVPEMMDDESEGELH